MTAGSSYHLHKIALEVPSVVDSIQSSTSCRGRWETVQGTWQHCQVVIMKKLSLKRCIHNPCKIRDKAQRPSVFNSTPSTAVSIQEN